VSLPDASAPLSVMPTMPVSPSAQMPVESAIARAAAATGVDFNYLLAQARLESGLDPSARARTSSARGLYQFTGSTWLKTLDRHGAEIGLDSGAAPRAQLLALRQDPQISAMMAGALANDNRNYLYGTLGRDPDNAELYLAHFLGPDGATKFLSALSSDPSQSAAALLPRAAAANRSIFFSANGARSVGEVMDLLRARFDTAMNAASPTESAVAQMNDTGATYGFVPGAALAVQPAVQTGGPLAREFAAAAAGSGTDLPGGSMADTLQTAFGLTETADGAVPAHVRQAYGRIRALGL
jgi:hypothetical protein